MAETGVLRPDARVELLDGRIIDMSPIGPFHGDVTTYLTEFFAAASKGRWRTRVQNPVRLDEHSEPQPDLVLAKPMADAYRKRHPRPEEIYLLIEVSDTSLEADLEDKLPAYGRAGIAAPATRTWRKCISSQRRSSLIEVDILALKPIISSMCIGTHSARASGQASAKEARPFHYPPFIILNFSLATPLSNEGQ